MGCVLLLGVIIGIPHGCDLLWGNAPMNLYGKVVDQLGNPVSNIPVEFTASAWERFQVPVAGGKEANWVVRQTTTADGTFAIHAGWGKALFPGKTGDLGRLNGNVPGPFHYGRGTDTKEFHGDVAHPVIFMSWNDAFKRVISREATARLGHEWYALAFRTGRFSKYGTGDENLEIRIIRPAGTPQPPYDWALEIEGIVGQVADAKGPLKQIAPEGPYTRSLRFPMSAADPGWSARKTVNVYSKGTDLLSMSRLYAGVEISVTLGANGGDPTVTLNYTANFGNSRDLVAGPVKPARK